MCLLQFDQGHQQYEEYMSNTHSVIDCIYQNLIYEAS